MRGRERGEGWIILRCAGRSTLRLAETLAEDGFEVWTPARDQHIRKPRWNVARRVRLPLLAGFVFAREGRKWDLVRRADTPASGFSVFRHNEALPVIADADLEPLRMAEKPATVRRKFARFAVGSEVRITEGSFEGFSATVEKSGAEFAVVWVSLFGRHQRVKISTFKMQPIPSISGSSAGFGTAARKAA